MVEIESKQDVVGRILDLRCKYLCDNVDEPFELHVTKQVEIELFRDMLKRFPQDTDEGCILRHYGMRTWPIYLGMKVIWDADSLEIK